MIKIKESQQVSKVGACRACSRAQISSCGTRLKYPYFSVTTIQIDDDGGNATTLFNLCSDCMIELSKVISESGALNE